MIWVQAKQATLNVQWLMFQQNKQTMVQSKIRHDYFWRTDGGTSSYQRHTPQKRAAIISSTVTNEMLTKAEQTKLTASMVRSAYRGDGEELDGLVGLDEGHCDTLHLRSKKKKGKNKRMKDKETKKDKTIPTTTAGGEKNNNKNEKVNRKS